MSEKIHNISLNIGLIDVSSWIFYERTYSEGTKTK